MKITVKLFASFTEYLPPELRHGNSMPLELAQDTTISQIVELMRLPPRLVHLVLVNGRYIEAEKRQTETLSEGDVLAIWPPIAGG
jgi:molybdopterin synthase sulfur carrier subunit